MALFRRRDEMDGAQFLAEASLAASASSAFNGVLIGTPLAFGLLGNNIGVLLVAMVILAGSSIIGCIGLLVHLLFWRGDGQIADGDRFEPGFAPAE